VYRRVVAYVVREGSLLVFDHRDIPEAGAQVPAGTVEDGEDPADAVVREVSEECGVRAQVARELGFTDSVAPRGEPRRNFFFELTTDDPRDEWEHVVVGGGGDHGLVFACRFVPLDGLPTLAGDDDFLDAL
jgi:8-oxo-dGTP pyrophosphatase MutT (NUDIX family)